MYTIIFHKDVYKDFKQLDKSISREILTVIKKKLVHDPIAFGKPLLGGLKGFYRLRIGNIRVIYKIQNKKLIVYILAIGVRKDERAYKTATRRLS